MADPYRTAALRAGRRPNLYIPEENAEWQAGQALIGPEAAWRRNYEFVLQNTGDPEKARIYADSIAATERRQNISQAATGLAGPVMAAGTGAVNLARGIASGSRAAEAPAAMRALPPPRRNAMRPDEMLPPPEVIQGTSAERAPRIGYDRYPRDVRGTVDPLDVIGSEGGLTQDAIDEARAIAQRASANRAQARTNQSDAMRFEGPNAPEEILRRRELAAQEKLEKARINREYDAYQQSVADDEFPGFRYNRPPGRGFTLVDTPGTGFTLVDPMGRAVATRPVGSQAARVPGTGFTGNFPRSNLDENVGSTALALRPTANNILDLNAVRNAPPMSLPTAAATIGASMAPTAVQIAKERAAQGEPEARFSGTESAGMPLIEPRYSGMETAGMPLAEGRYSGTETAGMPYMAPKRPADRTETQTRQQRSVADQPPRDEEQGRVSQLFNTIFSGKDYQSSGGNLVYNKDGQNVVNWGSSESPSDFFRASAAAQKLRESGKDFTGASGSDIDYQSRMEASEPRGGKAGGGAVDTKPSKEAMLHKALEIIHHMIRR